MNLTIRERIIVLSILPKEGNYAMLKILTNLRMSLAFTEEEVKGWHIVSDVATMATTWDEDVEAVEIPIGEKATDIIVDAFKKLDQENRLVAEMIDTYERFISTT